LLDRQEERAAIGQVLDTARDGFSSTLVLRGGAGVGKTVLLEYAIDAASDLRVTSVTGVQSEITMEFAALHQLLVPFTRGVRHWSKTTRMPRAPIRSPSVS